MKMTILRKILQYYNNQKLRQKLLQSYIVLIVIPLLLFYFITYRNFSNILQSKALFSANKSYSQAYSYISDRLSRVLNTINFVVEDAKVNQIVNRKPESSDVFQEMDDMNYLNPFLNNLEDKTTINKIRLYVNDDFIYANKRDHPNDYLYSIKEIWGTKWVNKLRQSGERLLWCPSDYFENSGGNTAGTISAITFLRSSSDFRKMVGLLRVDINGNNLLKIISNANTIKNCITYIENSEGIIVLSSDNAAIQKFRISDSLVFNPTSSNSWNTTSVNNESEFFHSRPIEGTDWYMVTVIPYRDIFSEGIRLRAQAFFQVIIIASIAYILAMLLSISITKRISHLINKMRNIQQTGSLSPLNQSSGKDEIGELIENYNYMIARIKLLLDQQYQMGLEVKNSELKVLQTQINPHFLYNTLDMVVCLSQENKYCEIEASVKALAKFYKLSLSKGKEVVTIHDELNHVSAYIDIQNIRFDNKINFIIDLDEYIQDFEILKITLQPIVENAIIHGIQGKASKQGTIVISGYMENDDIILLINDDGIGMPGEKLDLICSGAVRSATGSSYGIKNINERLKLFYGEKYSLNYKSEFGKGTIVEIRIPAKKENTGE